MKLYLIWQEVNNDYDTYDSAVVVAESEDEARRIHPDGHKKVKEVSDEYDTWCGLADVQIKYLGETELPKGVICASYNAG